MGHFRATSRPPPFSSTVGKTVDDHCQTGIGQSRHANDL